MDYFKNLDPLVIKWKPCGRFRLIDHVTSNMEIQSVECVYREPCDALEVKFKENDLDRVIHFYLHKEDTTRIGESVDIKDVIIEEIQAYDYFDNELPDHYILRARVEKK